VSTALAFDNEATTYTSRLMEGQALFRRHRRPPLLGILLARPARARHRVRRRDGTMRRRSMPTPPFMIGAGLASAVRSPGPT
jgi:hypothetical protein